jgi:Rrf2 family protein
MFTDRVRYILNVMVHLGLDDTEDYKTASVIAEEVDVPEAYLNKIIGELADLGYLKTKKGPSGGVQLRDKPDEIFMTQLLNDIEAIEHNPMGDACCVPQYVDNCIIEYWITSFKDDVVGKSTLKDVTDALQ